MSSRSGEGHLCVYFGGIVLAAIDSYTSVCIVVKDACAWCVLMGINICSCSTFQGCCEKQLVMMCEAFSRQETTTGGEQGRHSLQLSVLTR